jgi:4-amino-4-deoxy-L-arabinose transferase-like glycosyltransferase
VARSRSARALLVAALLGAALLIRIGYIEHTPYHPVNDASSYNRLASEMAHTGDYDTKNGAGGSRGPTAYFPPAFPYFLAGVDILTGQESGHLPDIPGDRMAQAFLGTITVGLIGLVALEAFGAAAGLASLVLAAVYPVLIELSGTLVAENLLVVFELAAVWTALRIRDARHPYAWITATGVLTGLATLTHQNAVLMLIPFTLAAWSVARNRPDRARPKVRALAAPTILLIVTTCVTIAPWTIRNAIELHHFVPVSDELGITLVGAYNPASAAFTRVPYKWRYYANIPQDAKLQHNARQYTEVALGARLESQALHFISQHPLAPLEVALHNTLRMFELEGSYAWHASARAIGLHPAVARTGVEAFWVVCVLALLGALTKTARRGPRWLWLVPVLFALSVVFINVETPRFREPIDPFLIMLAGCAVATAVQRLLLRGAPVRRGRRAPQLPRDTQLVEMGQRLA